MRALHEENDTVVTPGRSVTATLISWISWRTFATALAENYFGAAMARRGRKSAELGQYIRELRGERYQKALAEQARIAHSRWRQVEAGDVPPANTLWEMARALGATATQIERLFELAQYEEMFEHMTRVGASRAPGVPSTAELGISADPTLTPEGKAKALDYLRMLRQTDSE